jgi:hypothetical protein
LYCRGDNFHGALPDFLCVMLDRSRLWTDLLALLLGGRYYSSGLIEHDKACAGRALIDRSGITRHVGLSRTALIEGTDGTD